MDHRFSIVLILSIWAFALHAQNVNGLIVFQNSGGTPAEGVQISAFGCGSGYSNGSGMFMLPCNNKRPGQKLKLIIGSTDGSGKQIEVVNSKQIEWFRISNEPDAEPVEIVVCPAGQRDEASLRYYGILVSNSENEFNKAITAIEKKLELVNQNDENTAALIKQIEKLQKEKELALEKIEEQALFIASINQDRASELVREAIAMLDRGENVSVALEVLSKTKLDDAYLVIQEKKNELQEEIDELIQAYEFKSTLLLSEFKYNDAIDCKLSIEKILKENNYGYHRLIELYLEIGEILVIDADYEESLKYRLKALEILDNEDADDLIMRAEIYNHLASIYYDINELDKTLKYASSSKEIRVRELGDHHLDVARCDNMIGLVNMSNGKFDTARIHLENAISIFDNSTEKDSVTLAAILSNLSITLEKLGLLNEGLEQQQRALSIQQKILQSNDPKIASSYMKLGRIKHSLGIYKEALDDKLKAIEIGEASLNRYHPDLANFYNITSNTYSVLSQYAKSVEYSKKAIDIQEKALERKSSDLAISYFSLGSSYSRMGDNDQAIMFQTKAIGILEEVLDPMHPDLAATYNVISYTYLNKNENDTALEYLFKAKKIKEAILADDHPGLATLYSDMSICYSRLNDHENALKYQDKSLEIRKKKLDPNHPGIMQSYNSRAYILLRMEKYDLALESAETAREIGKISLPPNHVRVGVNFNTTGQIYTKLKKYQLAEEYLTKCRKVFEEIYPESHSRVGTVNKDLGLIYIKLEKYDEAKESLLVFEKINPESPFTFLHWAQYYTAIDDIDTAMDHLQKSIDLGYNDVEFLETNEMLEKLKDDPRFQEMIKRVKE